MACMSEHHGAQFAITQRQGFYPVGGGLGISKCKQGLTMRCPYAAEDDRKYYVFIHDGYAK
jgi:hypothetical protein